MTKDVSLVVMESGSDWPGHPGGCADIVALAHDDAALLHRTREKLRELHATQTGVSVAVLACGTAPASPTRAGVARELVAAVAGTRDGRLVLSARRDAPARLHEELWSLAQELSGELRGTTASVSLRFTASRAAAR